MTDQERIKNLEERLSELERKIEKALGRASNADARAWRLQKELRAG